MYQKIQNSKYGQIRPHIRRPYPGRLWKYGRIWYPVQP